MKKNKMNPYPYLHRILADTMEIPQHIKGGLTKDLLKMLKLSRVPYTIKQDSRYPLPYADIGNNRVVKNLNKSRDKIFILYSPKTGGVIFNTPEELQYLQSLPDEEVGKIHEEIQLTPYGLRYKPFLPK